MHVRSPVDRRVLSYLLVSADLSLHIEMVSSTGLKALLLCHYKLEAVLGVFFTNASIPFRTAAALVLEAASPNASSSLVC